MLPAEEVVRLARVRGADFIALTDHDTMAAVEEARSAGRRLGVRVIPGVEISSRWNNRDQHLLVYGLNSQDTEVDEFFVAMGQARRRRMEHMLDRLSDLGICLSWQHVAAELPDTSTPPCRPHLARALCRAGAVGTSQEAFVRLIGDDAPAFVAHEETLNVREVVSFCRSKGAVTILAHPGLKNDPQMLPDSRLLDEIDGLEVYHPGHDKAQIQAMLICCRERNLLVTGGSDAHDGPEIMRCGLAIEEMDILQQRIIDRGGLM